MYVYIYAYIYNTAREGHISLHTKPHLKPWSRSEYACPKRVFITDPVLQYTDIIPTGHPTERNRARRVKGGGTTSSAFRGTANVKTATQLRRNYRGPSPSNSDALDDGRIGQNM
jgi:hypothetical protein